MTLRCDPWRFVVAKLGLSGTARDPTAERGACRSRSWAAVACAPGAGDGQARTLVAGPVLRIFSLAAGLALAAPMCGAALPSGREPIQFLSPG